MKYLSPLITDARNSLGGATFARNRSGVYTRARVAPLQPRTVSQQGNRASFGVLSQQWRTLTQAQRDGWNLLASTVVLKDTLGQSYSPSGTQLYVGNNRNLQLCGRAQITDPPPRDVTQENVAGATVYASLDGSGNFFMSITVPNLIVESYPRFIIAATPGMSAGISFIARHMYRNLVPPFYLTGDDIEPYPQYLELLAPPTVGSRVGVRLTPVDANTGWAGVPVTANTIVELAT